MKLEKFLKINSNWIDWSRESYKLSQMSYDIDSTIDLIDTQLQELLCDVGDEDLLQSLTEEIWDLISFG
ncbi:hypothetical protein [Spirulina sp. 06S082]|uniref:hypothetical protein n=1 Tax=Spirulina sp. 06S082 TaxID=3110248 RepID=UPI002B215580|nr:hypothetical protein [Spirulina sp. 06S082]MEA5472150.1 hypothetical protein [Spirulina sp. 06S082]